MAEKLTSMTHKIATHLHVVAESCTICSSRSRNFWIHPRISCSFLWRITVYILQLCH